MSTPMPMEQTMTVVQPRHVSDESFWTTSPPEGFTERARQHLFKANEPRGNRIRTIAEEIAAASRNVD